MPELTGDDLNCLLHTSGTTGKPKGVMYNYRMIHNMVLCAALHAGVSRDSVNLTYAPLFHTAGLNAGTSVLHYGGCLNVMPRWDAEKCLRYLVDPGMGITHCIGVPTHYVMMSELPEFESANFPSLVCLSVGSAPVSMQLLVTWEAREAECRSSSAGGCTWWLTTTSGSWFFRVRRRQSALLGAAALATPTVGVSAEEKVILPYFF